MEKSSKMSDRVKVVLKSGKDQSVMRYHPWIFSGAIKKMYGEPAEGDEVEVYDNKDNFLAVGHYQPGSIAIRVMDFTKRPVDKAYYSERINSALLYRKSCGFSATGNTNGFRLIHAEGDNIPGLVADYYNGVVVLQVHSVGVYRSLKEIASIFAENKIFPVTAVYDKSENSLPYKSGAAGTNGYIIGSSTGTTISEHGFSFNIDWVGGQKTGFFLDQRENRKLLGSYTRGKKVLNLFGYTGGFSVYALDNAGEVDTVDVSEKAIQMANANVALNFPGTVKHRGIVADAFKYLDEMDSDYDVIVLDPPAFAKHGNVLHNALQGYKRLNMKAIEKIKRGGILFTFSCSQVVSRENFRKSVFVGAANTGRKVRILHQLSQPTDHPVNIYHPESEYLKGLVLYIE